MPIVLKSGSLGLLEPSSGIALSLPLPRRFLSTSVGNFKCIHTDIHNVQRLETELSLKKDRSVCVQLLSDAEIDKTKLTVSL